VTVTAVRARAYTIPTDQPEGDGTLAWDATTLVVVTVTDGDHYGLGWTYAGAGAVTVINEQLASVITGCDTAEIPKMAEAMTRTCRNLGRPGLVACAAAGTPSGARSPPCPRPTTSRYQGIAPPTFTPTSPPPSPSSATSSTSWRLAANWRVVVKRQVVARGGRQEPHPARLWVRDNSSG
jgi:hypothetical protein